MPHASADGAVARSTLARSAPQVRQPYWTNSALYLLGTSTAQGSVFIAGMVLANILGHASYGDYMLTYATVVTLSQMAQLGIGYMISRYLAEYTHSAPDKAQQLLSLLYKIALGLSGGASILLLVGADFVASDSFLRPDLDGSIRLASLAVWFASVNGFLLGALAGLQRYRYISLSLAAGGMSYLVLTTLLASWSGTTGAVSGFVAAQAIQNLALTLSIRGVLRRQSATARPSDRKANAALLVRFGIPGALSGFTALPALWLGNMLMARQPTGSHDVAVYNAAFSVAALVLFLPNVLNSVGMTLLNAYRGMGDPGRYRNLFLMNLAFTLTVTLLGIVAVGTSATLILSLYGPEFSAGHPVLLVLLAAVLPEALTIAMNQVIQSKEKMWAALLGVNIPRDALIATACLILIPAHGAMGMAYAYLSGRLLAACTTTALTLRFGLRL